MMKKLLFVCATAVCGLTTPLAADYNCCAPQYDPCCCGADFNGFYFGGNIGVFSHTAHRNDLDGALTDNSGWTTVATDFEAGVQLGYDWQCNSTLFGVVVDWNWADTRNRIRDNPNAELDNRIRSRHKWFTTIRFRTGVTVCDALVYVTGGAVVSRFKNTWRDDDTFGTFRHNRSRWGWVGGVGTEFMLGCSWSIGAELLFLAFSDHVRTFTNTAGTRFSFGHSDTAWLGRILVNWRFGDLFGGGCCW